MAAYASHVVRNLLRAVVRLSIWVDFGVVALIFSSNFCRLIADFGHFASDSRVCYCAVVGVVVWLWNGIKIVMSVLIIYFPVTAACYDGLRNTHKRGSIWRKPLTFPLAFIA